MAGTQAFENMRSDISDLTREADRVCIGDLLEQIGGRGFGALISAIAVFELTPLGGIPGLPTALACLIALIAVQMLFRRDHLWLPRFIENRSLNADNLANAVEKIAPFTRWADRNFGHRLEKLVGPASEQIAAVVILLLCLTVPPLELIPFASAAPMSAIALVGFALVARDGAVMLLAYFGAAAAGVAVLVWLT